MSVRARLGQQAWLLLLFWLRPLVNLASHLLGCCLWLLAPTTAIRLTVNPSTEGPSAARPAPLGAQTAKLFSQAAGKSLDPSALGPLPKSAQPLCFYDSVFVSLCSFPIALFRISHA